MKKIALFLLLALLSVAASAAATPEKKTITSDGKERTYYTYAPEKISAPAPLLLLLHGSGRDGMSQIEEWKGLAEKEGLVLVAPDSANSREWSMEWMARSFFMKSLKLSKTNIRSTVNGCMFSDIPRAQCSLCIWA